MINYNIKMDVPNYFEFVQDETYNDVLFCLFVLSKCRPQVYDHSIRVCNLYYKLSQLFEATKKPNKETIIGIMLHDIGKISIELELLYKRNSLSNKEFEKIKEHPFIGVKLLEHLNIKEETRTLIELHHERWDGKGYPRGKKNQEIPITCRLLTICDSIDAMLSERCYKRVLSHDECRIELINNAGAQFDPEMIKVVLENFDIVRRDLYHLIY